jgi:uridine kinase
MQPTNDQRNKGSSSWFSNQGLKCVVLCAGEGRRVFPFSSDKPKVMIEIQGKPVLGYLIDYWKRYSNDFVFVVGYKKECIIKFASQLPINSQFVEQKELKGIAGAVSYAKDLVSDHFILVLGDCLCRGSFDFPKDIEQGVGICKTDNVEEIKQGYSIKIENNLVCRVEEKPKRVFNNLCGMGFYFFDKRVFGYIKATSPSKLRNEIEITDVIQNMINAGEKISPVFFHGDYLNINYSQDIQQAEKLFLIEEKMSQTSKDREKIVIGIAGGSGSGKTTIAQKIANRINNHRVAVINQDAYYKDLKHLPLKEREKINFDHPDSIDNDLLIQHVRMLLEGQVIEKPIYSFQTHTRLSETQSIPPSDIVILEGILVLENKRLRDLMDIRIFVDTEADTRFIRRLKRDIYERGRTIESVINQYNSFVRPMHQKFVESSKKFADLIISDDKYTQEDLDNLVSKISSILDREKSISMQGVYD